MEQRRRGQLVTAEHRLLQWRTRTPQLSWQSDRGLSGLKFSSGKSNNSTVAHLNSGSDLLHNNTFELRIETSASASTVQLMLLAACTLEHSIGALSQVQGKSRSLVERQGCLCGIPAYQVIPHNTCIPSNTTQYLHTKSTHLMTCLRHFTAMLCSLKARHYP